MWLDDYFMSFRGHHAAFVAALLLLVASTGALSFLRPKEDIRRRLGAAYFSTDRAFGYRPAELYAMLECYAGDDYKAHKLFIFLDLFYPLLYSFSAAVMLGYLAPLVRADDHAPLHLLTLLPLAAALCDILENLSMLLILNLREGNPAGRSNLLANFSSAMTTVKLIFIYATLLLLATGLLALLARLVRR